MRPTRFIIGATFSAVILAVTAHAEDAVGKVCISRISIGERWDANDTGARESSTFTVRLDKLAPILVTTNAAGVFTNLSLAGEHTVVIRLDGKPLTSFRFSFQDRAAHRRLWYNPFYGTWSLWDVHPGERCACPKAMPTNRAGSQRLDRKI